MYIDSTNMKLQVLGETLQKAILNYQDVVTEMNNLNLNCDKYKNEIAELQTKMESKCQNCEELNTKLQCKNGVMESVASALTRLNETKNLNIITEIFNIICEDNLILTPPRDSPKANVVKGNLGKSNIEKVDIEKANRGKLNIENADIDIEVKETIESPNATMLNISVNESTSEIDGTPTTGRTSPIIFSKKPKSKNAGESVLETSKKKCSNSWPTSERKIIKLLIPTPPGPGAGGGRKKLRQSRITLNRIRATQTVDLTSSPELQTDQNQIKTEPLDVNDTILPSPTSGPLHLNFTNKKNTTTRNRGSPRKFKKPLDLFRNKMDNKLASPQKCDPMQVDLDVVKMENSISLLNNNRYKNSPSKLKVQENRIKCEIISQSDQENVHPVNDVDATRIEDSITLFQPPRDVKTTKYSQTFTEDVDHGKMYPDTNVSISILKQIEQLENDANRNVKQEHCSPNKMPIAENTNFKRTPPPLSDTEVSISVIQGAPANNTFKPQNAFEVQQRDKKRTPEKIEPIYKEPTVRKKAEKRALPGWSCDECKNFYSELYKDNNEMLAKLMEECSRHRGKHNPVRPRTPEKFWYPRWDVPDDTEAFNKRNNVS